MKTLLTCLIFLSTTAIFCQDSYTQAITGLSLEFNYYPIDSSKTNINYIGSGITLKEAILKYSKLSNTNSKFDYVITEQDFVNLTDIRITNLKSIEHVNYTYDYLTFMEYTFSDSCEAALFVQLLESRSNYLDEWISKGGIEYWLHEDKAYFIITAAYYMTYKYADIRKIINKYF